MNLHHNKERRKYVRLNSCFPVEFGLYFSPGNPISRQYQGFTCDISEGGLCLQARHLSKEDIELIFTKKPGLDLVINIPIWGRPVKALAEIAWVKEENNTQTSPVYHIGLSYTDIKTADKKRIVNYARRLKWLPPTVALLTILMLAGLVVLSFYHLRISSQNKVLVKQLVSASEVKSDIAKNLNEIKIRKEMLERSLSGSTQLAESLESAIEAAEEQAKLEKHRLELELQEALSQQRDLEAAITKLSNEGIGTDEMAYKVTESRLFKLNTEVELLRVELSEINKKSNLEKENLENELKVLQAENTELRDKILIVSEGEILLEEQLAKARYESGEIEKASIHTMLDWLKTHQIRRTGLVLSYEGDPSLRDWGFTYDQALASQVFLILGEQNRAKSILDFFNQKAKKDSQGLFYNAYDAKAGTPREHIVHFGPNIWLAITACQYAHQTQDFSFLSLAENIALRAIDTQRLSNDGSIKGGPDVEWVSTEHNLDAYAMFIMLYRLTEKGIYAEAADNTLNWLKTAGYNREEGRFMRGKGDATIATDTFSWAIAALGPEILAANGMDPDGIMEFAESECRVETRFYRPEGRSVEVVGFDFAKAAHVGRGGIISTEWTAQMAVAFQAMAEYHQANARDEQARIYNLKSQYYLAQLGKMVISSPSPTGQGQGCLPYASMDDVDTGHGWRVAKGRRTGSVAGTAYYMFAYMEFNPLAFD
jgi:hypothetical protein